MQQAVPNLIPIPISPCSGWPMRELYWEGHRRTDLIRFEKFTSGNYLWPWKGGVYAGKSLDTKYNLYPIPAKEIAANPGIQQNYGY